jgi:rRNA-processing protein FCF1
MMTPNKTILTKMLKKSRQILTDTKFLRTVEKMMISIKDFTSIYSFILPESLEQEYRIGLKQYKSQFYGKMDISFPDYVLGCIARELNLPIVSYDHHINRVLQNEFEINVIWPEDIEKIPVGTPILLDTNIILGKFNNSHDIRQKIQKMLSNSDYRFYIPYCILEEYENVLKRNKKELLYKFNKKSQHKATILNPKSGINVQQNCYKQYYVYN